MRDLREQLLTAWTERRDGETRAMLASGASIPVAPTWCRWDLNNHTLGGPQAGRVLAAAIAFEPSLDGFYPEWHALESHREQGIYQCIATLVRGRTSFFGRDITIKVVIDGAPVEGSAFRVLRVEEVHRG